MLARLRRRSLIAGLMPASLLASLLASAIGCAPRIDQQRADDGAPATDEASANGLATGLALAGTLEPGPHVVGFRRQTVELMASAQADRPTAVDLYLWYPAQPTGTRPMVFSDYYRVQESEEPDRATLREWLRADMTEPPDVTEAQIDGVLDAPMTAHRDATPVDQRFPLALWTYRDSIPTMQSVLNEYLASHGYVVAFAWPRDHAPPLPWQGDLDADDKLDALDIQVDVIEQTLDHLLEDPLVDPERAALLAWSYGGESAHRLQQRRPELRAVIGIDATIVSGWIFQPGDAIASVTPNDLPVPHVLLRNGTPRIGAPASSAPAMLEEVEAGAWFVRFGALSHGNFNVPGGMIPGVLGLEKVSDWAVGGEDARFGYETICRLTRHILDAYTADEEPNLPIRLEAYDHGLIVIERYPAHADRSQS